MKIRVSKGIAALLLSLSLGSCQQKIWQAEASLSQTDVPVDQAIPADPQAEAYIAPYREQVNAKMSEVIGHAPADMPKGEYQSPLGNFVADLMLAQSRPLYDGTIDMATTTNGGLRIPVLPAGPVKVETVFELMPFENELVVLTLDGQHVQAFFDKAAAARFAPVANATYTVKNGKATDIRIAGRPFNPQQQYNVLTTDYLATGGDNLTMFTQATKTDKVGLMLRDAIMQHIRQLTASGKAVEGAIDNRVTVLP